MKIEKKYTILDADAVSEIVRNNKVEGKEYENFLIYSDERYPAELIDENRPNEHDIVKEYRKKTYQPVFAEVFDRVLNSLQKIGRSDGFFLKFPLQDEFSKIAKGEKLEDYLNHHFTKSKSLFNWAFQVGLKQSVIDVNGVIVLWSDAVQNNTEYKKPCPVIINSDRILYSYEGYSVVYKDEHDKNVYYSIDTYSWSKWEKSKKSNDYILTEQIPHDLGIFPGFTIGGIVEEEEELGREYQSVFKAMLPWLNVATIEFSDLRAEITQHIHSTIWIYQDEQCPDCKGTGWGVNNKNERVTCTNSKCKGGQIPVSPYETLRVRPAKTNMGEAPAPTPPMGFVQKQTEIAELQDKRINEMRYRSLAAVNMQFLESTPAAESGVAKAYDRDETNNTFYAVATNLAIMMERISYFVAKWRYNLLYDDAALKSMCPIVVVPNTFDVLGSDTIADEIKRAKDSTLNDAVQSEMEIEYIKKRFPNHTALQNKLELAFKLDPASGKTDEQKALLVSNKMMSKQDAVVSTYISDFIDRAFDENANFLTMDKKAQYAILITYAEEKLKDINTKDIMLSKIFGTSPDANSGGGKTASDLKYTVGGMTSIIEVVKAVSSGVYDLEAAIALVMDRFGLTYEEAKRQLGTPQQVTSTNEADKINKLI